MKSIGRILFLLLLLAGVPPSFFKGLHEIVLAQNEQYSGQYSGAWVGQSGGQWSGQYSGHYSGQFTGQSSSRAGSVEPGLPFGVVVPRINTGSCGELHAPANSGDPFLYDSEGRRC